MEKGSGQSDNSEELARNDGRNLKKVPARLLDPMLMVSWNSGKASPA
jgi:hypothetical protein